jgi:hypothetical protein
VAYSTVYDVKVRYSVDNKAGRSATQGLTKDVRQLGNEAKRTSGIFGRLGAAAVAAFGARAAGKALIGFNATVEDTKNQIAGMLALSKKTDLSAQIGVADRLYGNLQKRAASLPGTTSEYVQMLGSLTQPLSAAGATLKEMEDLTVNSVVGAKALGIAWDVASRDIDQALRGQFRSTDAFTGKLLGSMGYSGEEGRAKFNAMGAGQRKEALQAALMQKQLTQLAAAQGASFGGMLSTLQDTVEQFLGKVGAPLFRVITAELKQWNAWISSNEAKLEGMAQTIGGGLVTGFQAIRETIAFLVSHIDEIIMAGKVWAAVKVGSMAMTGASAVAGSFAGGKAGGFLDFFRGASDGFDADGNYTHKGAGRGRSKVGGIKGALGSADLLLGAGVAGYTLGNALGLDEVGKTLGGKFAQLTGRADSSTLAMEKLERQTAHLARTAAEAAQALGNTPSALVRAAGASLNFKEQADLVEGTHKAWEKAKANPNDLEAQMWYARKKADMEAAGISAADFGGRGAMGYVDHMRAKATTTDVRNTAAGGATMIAMNLGIQKLTEYQRKSLETEQAQEQIAAYMVASLARGDLINPDTVMEILRRNTADPSGTKKTLSDKPKVNVTIQRIEVQSDDPDRMAFGLIESFRDAAKNPSSALSAIREG